MATLKLRLRGLAEIVTAEISPHDAALEGFIDPPPGVDSIPAQVLDAVVDGQDVLAQVELDPRDYLRQEVQYGTDLYQVLQELQPQLTPEQLRELVQWVATEPLTVAIIAASPQGLDAWQAPAAGL